MRASKENKNVGTIFVWLAVDGRKIGPGVGFCNLLSIELSFNWTKLYFFEAIYIMCVCTEWSKN